MYILSHDFFAGACFTPDQNRDRLCRQLGALVGRRQCARDRDRDHRHGERGAGVTDDERAWAEAKDDPRLQSVAGMAQARADDVLSSVKSKMGTDAPR